MYQIDEDRCERNNLVKEKPEVAEAMERLWQAWADRVGVVMPKALPKYTKDYRRK